MGSSNYLINWFLHFLLLCIKSSIVLHNELVNTDVIVPDDPLVDIFSCLHKILFINLSLILHHLYQLSMQQVMHLVYITCLLYIHTKYIINNTLHS